jgi:PAS domain S-box-containing protein
MWSEMSGRFSGDSFPNPSPSIQEERLNSALDAARVGVWEWDLRSRTLVWNASQERLFGYDPGFPHRTEKDFSQRLHPDDKNRVLQDLQEAAKQESEYESEYRVIWPDGSIHWVQAKGRLVRAELGRPVYLRGVMMEVTERKKREEALQESHENYQRIVETASEGIWVIDENHITTFVNQKMAEMLGYTPEEMIGNSTFDYTPSEDLEAGREALERRRAGQSEYAEWSLRHRDGRMIFLSTAATPILEKNGRYRGAFAMCSDITERKQIERKLRESEERLASALEAAQMGTWVWNNKAETLLCSETLIRLWGYEPSEWKNSIDQFWKRLHPDDYSTVQGMRDQAWLAGYFEVEYRVIWPDNSIHWIYAKGRAQFDREGNPERFTGTAMDATRKKQAEIALRRSKETLQAIIDNTPAVIYMKDRNSRLVMVNKGLEALMGQEAESLIGRSDHDFWKSEYADRLRDNDLKVFETGRPLQTEEKIAIDGEERTFLVNKFPVYVESWDDFVVCGISMDITEQKKSENDLRVLSAELQRSNKELEQFASLASHDLKEPIRMVTTYLQLLHKKIAAELDETSRSHLGFALENSKRMCDLVDSLLKYARVGSRQLEVEEVEVNALMGEVIESLGSVIDESKTRIDVKRLPSVRADRIQLSQVFQNLVSNAIKFTRKEDQSKLSVSCEETNGEWIFVVEDNGIGIEPQYRDEIFDVFRRLHSHSEYPGEGIGLATCKRIVERHGGQIWVKPSALGGAAFYFTLPRKTSPPVKKPEGELSL